MDIVGQAANVVGQMVAKARAIDASDVLVVGGTASLATGVGFIYWPAALVVVGVIALGLGLWAMAQATEPPNEEE